MQQQTQIAQGEQFTPYQQTARTRRRGARQGIKVCAILFLILGCLCSILGARIPAAIPFAVVLLMAGVISVFFI